MKVGVVQITSHLDPEVNLKKIRTFFDEAQKKNCRAVFLPEVFYTKSDGENQTPYLVSFDNDHFKAIEDLVSQYDFYVLGGSVVFKDQGIIRNRVLNFAPGGKTLDYYDKINLFSCDVIHEGKQLKLDEGNLYTPGNTPKIIEADEMKLGLSVCFDVRFPKLYQDYVDQGVNALSISAAFTVPTGKAHWETLVRARAIETQCFVFASCQWGKHNGKMESFGHSLIISPWGDILANGEQGEKLLVAEIDFLEVGLTRKKVILGK